MRSNIFFCAIADGKPASTFPAIAPIEFYPAFRYNPGYPEDENAKMIRVSSTEFGKEVGRYQDAALSQPVIVTRNGRDRTVMISAEEFLRLKKRDRRVYVSGELPEETLEAIRNSKMDPRHNHLDELIKDWTP